MSYGEENRLVILEMSAEDYELQLSMLRVAHLSEGEPNPAAEFPNRLNEGNPNWTAYFLE